MRRVPAHTAAPLRPKAQIISIKPRWEKASRLVHPDSIPVLPIGTPKHPYTLGLLESMPDLKKTGDGKKLITIPGSPPDLLNPPIGCAFAARCKHCMDVCKQYEPPVSEINNEHKVACWLLDARAPKVTE